MAHEIDQTTGEAAIAFAADGGTPWHGLGQPVKRGASVKEMLKAGQLNWPVKMAGVQFARDGVGTAYDSDHQVMYRGDTGIVLDITGKKYVPFQNEEVLGFFKEFVDAGEMTLETVGALNGGKRVWALARMEKSFTLPGKDKVEGYVLLMNPHQYGKGAILKFTPVRVVCSNTMAMAMPGDAIKLWHNRPFDTDMQEEAKWRLGIARERLDAFKEAATTLSKWDIDVPIALEALKSQFQAKPEKPMEEQSPTVRRLIELYEGAGRGAELAAASGTAWGLLNAVTQYIDHEYGRTKDARLTNAWLGSGSVKKNKVMNDLLTLGGQAKAA